MIPALQGYLAAVEESLADAGALGAAATELASVAQLVEGSTELSLAVNDGSVPAASRRAVLDHLLEGKVRDEVGRLIHQAVTVMPAAEVTVSFHWLAARVADAADRGPVTDGGNQEERVLGRQASRKRVSGYAAAVFDGVGTSDLEEIEDQLFRFARTVESNRALRGALGDRDLPVAVRLRVVGELLGDRVVPATRRLAAYAVRGGRARDVVATLDALVVDAARARGWRVAHVQSADTVNDEQRRRLGEALGRLAGNPVELQVAIDPRLLGGVVVQVGDLLVDGSARHRLNELKDFLVSSEESYRIRGVPEGPGGRETADG